MVDVIYADILFIVNVYVNYALLKITACLLKRDVHIFKVLVSAILGGFYSFIILFDNLPFYVTVVSRVLFAFLIALIAFGFKSIRVYLRSVASFFCTSFVFAGLMYFLWTFFSPPVMAFCNSVVYFDIDTLDLCVMTIICYAFLKVFDIISKSRQTENTIYEITVYIKGKMFSGKAFLDTGNGLYEPFSSYPVIVVNEEIKSSEESNTKLCDVIKNMELPLRVVPCNTVSGSTLLNAFRPDKVKIKGIDINFETDKVYIATTNNKIKGEKYAALIGSSVFEGKTTEAERDYRKQTV